MEVIATILGHPVTLGFVASLLVQVGKFYKLFDRIPDMDVPVPLMGTTFKLKTLVLRGTVGAVSLALNCLGVVLSHGHIEAATLWPTFISYVTAAAVYDHLLAQ